MDNNNNQDNNQRDIWDELEPQEESDNEAEAIETPQISSSSSNSSVIASEEDSTQMGAEHSDENGTNSPSGMRRRRKSSSSNKSEKQKKKITFNKDLPATHSYLGQDLEDVGGGHTVMDQEEIVDNVPLFPVPHLILMPGQTLPLQSLHPRAISMFRNIIERHRIFAVISMRYREDGEAGQELSSIGTLAQVVAYKEQTEHEVTALKMRAVGRQRFELIETRRTIDGTLVGKVRVLPEISLPDALRCADLPCRNKFRLIPVNKSCHTKRQNHRYNKYFASVLTPVPWQVYRQYDIDYMVTELIAELSKWYEADRVKGLSENHVDFSYWVASNLPIDDRMKLQLLAINCCTQRFRAELSLLRRCTRLVCRSCRVIVGEKSDVFSMSVDGPMSAYVNPGGFIHEMITLYKTTKLSSVGLPQTLNSWFPGYAWTILDCSHCHSHMGWRFTATKKSLKPSKFWGLTRMSILPSLDDQDEDDNEMDKNLCL